jgi:hypothetical protein
MFKSFTEEEAEEQRLFPLSVLFIYLFIYLFVHFLQLDRGGGRGAATFCGETKAAATPGVWLYHVVLT